MAQAAAVHLPARRPSALRVGTIVWLSSELMFFAGLFAAYFFIKGLSVPWPPEGAELETARTALFTALLVSSSFTMHLAVRAAEGGDRRSALNWTLTTAALGTLFVANQAAEWAGLGFDISSHAYGSLFYLLTGFHGLHVIGGLVLMLAVLAVGLGRASRAPLVDPLVVTEYYWHFVDVVWVGMFTTIYLVR